MIQIFDTKLNGKTFFVNNDASLVEWTCIGIGTPPDKGYPFIVGARFDAPNNRSVVDTFKLSNVAFKGNVLS